MLIDRRIAKVLAVVIPHAAKRDKYILELAADQTVHRSRPNREPPNISGISCPLLVTSDLHMTRNSHSRSSSEIESLGSVPNPHHEDIVSRQPDDETFDSGAIARWDEERGAYPSGILDSQQSPMTHAKPYHEP